MPSPGQLFSRIMVLWYAGRLDETDLAIARASELYPTHFAIWFARFYVALYTGRAETAVALAADRSQHPSGIPSEEIQSIERVARAFLAPSAPSTSVVMDEQVQRAKAGSGHAENAIQFAAALGRLDVALNLLRAYYFGENFVIPEVRYTVAQGTYTPFNDRQTAFLFAPSLVSLRDLPAFGSILRQLGLERYWHEVGVKPDFRQA